MRALQHGKFLNGNVFHPIYIFEVRGPGINGNYLKEVRQRKGQEPLWRNGEGSSPLLFALWWIVRAKFSDFFHECRSRKTFLRGLWLTIEEWMEFVYSHHKAFKVTCGWRRMARDINWDIPAWYKLRHSTETTITGPSFSAGILRNRLPGSVPISLQ